MRELVVATTPSVHVTDPTSNFEPRMILELADCHDRIQLDFDVDSEAGRSNSLHKLDTLLAALRIFREGIVEEFEPYDRRQRELDELCR